ncbi:MAG: alpha/beta hydrolase [Betaproteobacteria bacterium]|nr:alpha/beta hydrolase [Betaproteobacteria bacterium]
MLSLLRNLTLAVALLTLHVAFAQSLTFRQVLDRPDRPQPDHKIAYGPGPNQYGELWLPKTTTKAPLPVVVLIHGGCWLSELPGPELLAFLSDGLRNKDVAVWSITYRRVSGGNDNPMGGGYPATFNDIASGVDYLRKIAPQYNLDLKRIVTSGHSAGGHLAAWAAARAKLPADSPLRSADPLPIKGMVGIAGLVDLAYAASATAFACGDKTVEKLIDSDKRGKKEAFRDTSPIELLPLGSNIRQVLVSGTYDGIVPPVHGWRYANRAKEKGEAVEVVNLDNAGHFELISPWTAPGRALVDKIVEVVKQ